MGKAKILLKSSFLTKNPRADRKPTVYRRSLLKLTDDKKHPGQIIRIYVHIDDDYKLFGVFTINAGGSISFFPDFYHLDAFDHLTLSKDFVKKNGHLTKIEGNGIHKKAYHFEVSRLPTGDYHLITFAMKDGDLLMDCLPEIEYADIEFENAKEAAVLRLLESALYHNPIMLEFPQEDGAYLIQILVVPKRTAPKEVSIALGFEEMFSVEKPIDNILNAIRTQINTPQDFDCSLCIICFKIPQELRSPFLFGMN